MCFETYGITLCSLLCVFMCFEGGVGRVGSYDFKANSLLLAALKITYLTVTYL